MHASQKERETIATLDLWAQGLLALGRRAEAIAKWQSILDRFPKHPDYAKYEAKIEDALGVSPEQKQQRRQEQSYREALKSCDPVRLIQTAAMRTAMRTQKLGSAAIRLTVQEVDEACAKVQAFDQLRPTFYYTMSTMALGGRDCPLARALQRRFTEAARKAAVAGWQTQADVLEDLLARQCP